MTIRVNCRSLLYVCGRGLSELAEDGGCYVLDWLTRIGVQSLKLLVQRNLLLVQRNLAHCDYLLNPARAADKSAFAGGVVDPVFVLRVEGR